jgi:hypothetical protein
MQNVTNPVSLKEKQYGKCTTMGELFHLENSAYYEHELYSGKI